jgi:hypothetical protein
VVVLFPIPISISPAAAEGAEGAFLPPLPPPLPRRPFAISPVNAKFRNN